MRTATADDERYRLAATPHAKIGVVRQLVERHKGERILVIGQYLDQIDILAEALNAEDHRRHTDRRARGAVPGVPRGEISLLRQRFLAEQGYAYPILDADRLAA